MRGLDVLLRSNEDDLVPRTNLCLASRTHKDPTAEHRSHATLLGKVDVLNPAPTGGGRITITTESAQGISFRPTAPTLYKKCTSPDTLGQ